MLDSEITNQGLDSSSPRPISNGMDAMMLAQMKRTAEWYAQEVRHLEHNLNSAELALEGAKKNVEMLKKKLVESKRKLDQMYLDIQQAQKEVREQVAKRGQQQ